MAGERLVMTYASGKSDEKPAPEPAPEPAYTPRPADPQDLNIPPPLYSPLRTPRS